MSAMNIYMLPLLIWQSVSSGFSEMDLEKHRKRLKNLQQFARKITRNADLKWEKVPGAVGYNVLWGIAPDKLYQTYQFWNDEPNTFELTSFECRRTLLFCY